jgi:glycosyltransferase involved in cell wall biosynthesis
MHLIVPGPLDQRTGGYLYDARMVREIRRAGGRVTVHELPGRFPELDAEAEQALDTTLAGVGEGETVVLDGLAMGCAGQVLADHARRLRLLGLVHHPLADEEGLPPQTRDRYRALETEALATVRGVVVTSPFTAKRLEVYGVAADRVRVVLPGTGRTEAAVGPGADAPARLLCVATLIPRKGQLDLVRALAKLQDRPWSCVLAGSAERDPAYARGVRQEIAEHGLAARIHLAGELDEEGLEEEWRQATLFVLPSFYEGYGMALTEALARGLPVVSTTGGAIPWTVPDGAALLVPPGDVGALRDALCEVLDDADRRGEMSRMARRAARSFPDWPEQARALAAAILELSAP